jgi:hypothetical protein
MLHKDFMAWSESVTARIKADAIRLAETAGGEPIYLTSSAVSKEEAAVAEAERRGITTGLIGVFSCVEPCLSYALFRNRQQRTLDLQRIRRKCLHYYFYWLHPAVGLCHLRLQTWAPFSVQVCLNGRERLACQLTAAQIAHVKRDNCFTWIADMAAAQKLSDAQLQTRWEGLLDGLLDQTFPARQELFPEPELRHYWSLQQSEWATDLLFQRTADLERLYPPLVRHAMSVFQSDDVLRFLGRLNTGRVFAPGEFLLNGFRNRDLCAALTEATPSSDPKERRKVAARVTRQIARLRAHGLVRKVSGTHRYLLTTKGAQLCTAVLHLNHVEIQEVVKLAA